MVKCDLLNFHRENGRVFELVERPFPWVGNEWHLFREEYGGDVVGQREKWSDIRMIDQESPSMEFIGES
jgi:hypothetical protein